MPSGASRMTHQRIFCTTASADRVKPRNGSAALPLRRAAMPTTIATTTICSTLNEIAVVSDPSVCCVLAPRPRKLLGIRPLRKSSQLPVVPTSEPASGLSVELLPGWKTSPSPMPIATETAAVIANQRSVCQASRAALVTCCRLAIDATIARNTSGGTIVLSSVTNEAPMVSSVVVSQFGSPAAVGPICSATQPRRMPSPRPSRTWTEKDGRRSRRVRCVVVSDTELPGGATAAGVLQPPSATGRAGCLLPRRWSQPGSRLHRCMSISNVVEMCQDVPRRAPTTMWK